MPEGRGVVTGYSIGVVCSVGIGEARGGRAVNQDNYLVCRAGKAVWRDGDVESVSALPKSETVLIAVADGMGGHEDGEIAAASAVQAMARLYSHPVPPDPEGALRAYLLECHRLIRARAQQHGEVKMGTTLTAAWIIDGRAWWAHVGDSRLYHWRAGRITRVTRDQTREEFALRDGRSIPPHPRYLAQNFIYGSRGLGNDAAVRIDRGLDTGCLTLLPGDRLLLCSDGLHGRVDDQALAECMRDVPEPNPCAVALMERAVSRESDDNITALVARADGDVGTPWDDENTIVPV